MATGRFGARRGGGTAGSPEDPSITSARISARGVIAGAVITSIFALAGLAYQHDQAEQTQDGLQETLDRLSTSNADLKESVDILSEKILELGGEIPALPSDGITPTRDDPGPEDTAVSIRRQTQDYTLARGMGLDLDAPADSADWIVNSYGSEKELSLESHSSYVLMYVKGDYAFMKGTGYEACVTASGRTSANLKITEDLIGEHLCFRTEEHRYAELFVHAVTPDSFTFDVVVWDPPFDES